MIMEENLKNIDLIEELHHTFEDLERQLEKDEERWGDTWKERGLVWNGLSQEERFMMKMQEYFTDWKDMGVPFPWLKVMGEAHIGFVRENYILGEK